MKKGVEVKYNILRIVFLVWLSLWVWFLVRDIFIKDGMKGTRTLLARDLEGKRSYVTGDRLYQFIKFAKNNIPPNATYKIVGFEEGSIELRRMVYYMYPRTESEEPEYMLVYDKAGFGDPLYSIFMKLDDERYLVKRKQGI